MVRITIDIDESSQTSTTVGPSTAVVGVAPDVQPSVGADSAIDAGACAEPTAAAFLAGQSDAATSDANSSAGAAPEL